MMVVWTMFVVQHSKKWLNSGRILEPIGLADGLDVGSEDDRRGER